MSLSSRSVFKDNCLRFLLACWARAHRRPSFMRVARTGEQEVLYGFTVGAAGWASAAVHFLYPLKVVVDRRMPVREP